MCAKVEISWEHVFTMPRAQTLAVGTTAAGVVWLIDFLPGGLEVARGFGDALPWTSGGTYAVRRTLILVQVLTFLLSWNGAN